MECIYMKQGTIAAHSPLKRERKRERERKKIIIIHRKNIGRHLFLFTLLLAVVVVVASLWLKWSLILLYRSTVSLSISFYTYIHCIWSSGHCPESIRRTVIERDAHLVRRFFFFPSPSFIAIHFFALFIFLYIFNKKKVCVRFGGDENICSVKWRCHG